VRILIVDDYPGAADACRLLLDLLGHECEIATTGTEALAQMSIFEPDLVLLDIGLPDLNGYEVAQQIRGNSTMSHVFIAAMTGWATPLDRERSLASGIDVHVEKPPRRETFESLIERARQSLAKAREPSKS
jgi:two-component system, chemotaxis family, CheB/CheR fusion protein